jgi:hypothetical protein
VHTPLQQLSMMGAGGQSTAKGALLREGLQMFDG